MLGKLFCVLAIFILIVATQLRRYPLKRQNSPSSLFSCPLFFFFIKLYTGTFNGLALTRKTKSAFIRRVQPLQCAGPLLGLALAFSLSQPPVSLFILCSSNSIILQNFIFLPQNSCKRKFQFFLMKNANKSLISSYVFSLKYAPLQLSAVSARLDLIEIILSFKK